MDIQILKPESSSTKTVLWLECHTTAGSMIIQEQHAPFVAQLTKNKDILLQLENGKQQTIEVGNGFIHVTRSIVKIFLHE